MFASRSSIYIRTNFADVLEVEFFVYDVMFSIFNYFLNQFSSYCTCILASDYAKNVMNQLNRLSPDCVISKFDKNY